jgi:hypothetical protein
MRPSAVWNDPGEPRRLAVRVLLAALLVGAGSIVACGSSRPAAAAERSRSFQRAVSGLGLGTAIHLSRRGVPFDVRLGDRELGRTIDAFAPGALPAMRDARVAGR